MTRLDNGGALGVFSGWVLLSQYSHGCMTSFRILVLVLAVIHAAFAGLTAMVGAFADGGDVWQRLLVSLLHPLGAAGVLLLVWRPSLDTKQILAIVALLTANVIADLRATQLLAAGVVRGDWELAVAFSVVPAIGILYALARLRTARTTPAAGVDTPGS